MGAPFGACARPLRLAGLCAALFIYMAHAPAAAMQILSATDHAELTAEISATSVSRVALAGDRIARVIRAPGGFTVGARRQERRSLSAAADRR